MLKCPVRATKITILSFVIAKWRELQSYKSPNSIKVSFKFKKFSFKLNQLFLKPVREYFLPNFKRCYFAILNSSTNVIINTWAQTDTQNKIPVACLSASPCWLAINQSKSFFLVWTISQFLFIYEYVVRFAHPTRTHMAENIHSCLVQCNDPLWIDPKYQHIHGNWRRKYSFRRFGSNIKRCGPGQRYNPKPYLILLVLESRRLRRSRGCGVVAT